MNVVWMVAWLMFAAGVFCGAYGWFLLTRRMLRRYTPPHATVTAGREVLAEPFDWQFPDPPRTLRFPKPR